MKTLHSINDKYTEHFRNTYSSTRNNNQSAEKQLRKIALLYRMMCMQTMALRKTFSISNKQEKENKKNK